MTKLLSATALVLALAGPGLAQETPDPVARGEYLVATSGCNDCHTPFKMGENGPEWDMERMLSGHPDFVEISAPAVLPEPWIAANNATNTAFSGPWGVSFSANLTPDPETGVLRDFDEAKFIETLRTGRHLGLGREILPPMPWPVYGQMKDEDLKAIYAYLRTIPAVRNQVPQPLPPVGATN